MCPVCVQHVSSVCTENMAPPYMAQNLWSNSDKYKSVPYSMFYLKLCPNDMMSMPKQIKNTNETDKVIELSQGSASCGTRAFVYLWSLCSISIASTKNNADSKYI